MKVANGSSHDIWFVYFLKIKKNYLVMHNVQNMFFRFHIIIAHLWGYLQLLLHLLDMRCRRSWDRFTGLDQHSGS